MKKASNEKSKTHKKVIKGALKTAAIGAFLADENNDNNSPGDLVEAAVLATNKANQLACDSKLPMYFEENGILFLRNEVGEQSYIREIVKSGKSIPESFILK